jgi:hypothetical protein
LLVSIEKTAILWRGEEFNQKIYMLLFSYIYIMETPKLESLVVHVPGQIKSDPLEQAQETLRLATEVADEIKRATAKCQSVTQIDGHPASIVGLNMTGRTSVENIGITYISNGVSHTRDYPKQEFYEL